MELRCDAKKHGELIDVDGEPVIEVKCSSRFCGAGPGVVVLHRFGQDGKLLVTSRYRDPVTRIEEG